MRSVCILALVLGGCVYEWTSDQPAFPVTGTAPPLASFEKLNTLVAGRASFVTSDDGATWVAFCEFVTARTAAAPGRACTRLHLVRLGLRADEVLEGDRVELHGHEVYLMKDDAAAMTRTISLHRIGDSRTGDVAFVVVSGNALLLANDDGEGDVFVYLPSAKDTTHYDVYRRDLKFQRRFALPAAVDPTKPDAQTAFDFQLTSDGNTLVVLDPDGKMTANSTLSSDTVALGARPSTFFLDDPRSAVVTRGDDGLRSVPLGGGADVVLWPGTIDAGTLSVIDDAVWFGHGGALWRVPLDGSSAAAMVQSDAARPLVLGPGGALTYSRDPTTRYAGGAGDGWLGEWRFMERGRRLAWSADGTRLRFLEHAATLGTYGDLTSVSIPGGAPQTLGINVHSFAELPDGRVLAVENAVYAGAWNRLVVIDERAATKHWVAPSVQDFLLAPSGKELIADVVSGASGFDILRVPAP